MIPYFIIFINRSFVSDVTHFMKIRNVGKDLKMKIMRYLEYRHSEETSGFQRGESLIKCLTSELKQELNTEIFKRVVNEIAILKENFSEKFLLDLSSKIQEKFYAPDDIIFKVIKK